MTTPYRGTNFICPVVLPYELDGQGRASMLCVRAVRKCKGGRAEVCVCGSRMDIGQSVDDDGGVNVIHCPRSDR